MAENADLGVMEIDHVEAIGNGDIINLVSILDTGLRQFSRAPSASMSDTHKADVKICGSLIAFFKKRFLHFADEPELYMPRAHPKPKRLPAPPVVKIIENGSLQNLMYSLAEMRVELLNCNDAERSNGFRAETISVVINPWILKFEKFVKMMEEDLATDELTWFPEVDLHEPGINAGEPR